MERQPGLDAPAEADTPLPLVTPVRTFSLAELFVLVTACAVVAGVGAPVFRQLADFERWPELLGASFVGALGGVVFGIVLGAHRYAKLAGLFECAGVGLLLGGMAGPLYCLPPEGLVTSALTMLIGSGLLVVIGCLTTRFRLAVKQPARTEAASNQG